MELVSVGVSPSENYTTTGASKAVKAVPKEGYAITVRHAHVQYSDTLGAIASGSVPTTHVVLEDFNMSVDKGHIYALLGASGCGKTTILRAVVGLRDLLSGEIRVLGHKPNTPGSGIPGATIGYMPQEASLIEEFTIKETLTFYGQLLGMSNDEIEAQTKKLSVLLKFPPLNRVVGTLSGGQQRRVSFAIALLHQPPVLILDEPTVGLDPELRESIWKYLKTIVESDGITVVITTHYILEATQADTVGLMRDGRLMAEQSPHSLIESLECNDLEEVLLKLCLLQSTKERSISFVGEPLVRKALPVDDSAVNPTVVNRISTKMSPFKRIKALARKNVLSLCRPLSLTVIITLLPVLLCIGCYFAMEAPTGLHISVHNKETDCTSEGNTTKMFMEGFCSKPRNLSCEVLRHLKRKDIIAVSSGSIRAAEDDVRRGASWAALTFKTNFTSALIERIGYSSPFDITEDMVDMGTIYVAMDQSDRIIAYRIQAELLQAIAQTLNDFDDICHTLPHVKKGPIQFYPPVYGHLGASFRDYVFPSLIAALSFKIPLVTTLSALLSEKLEGTLERSMVSGVTLQEVVAAIFIVYLPFTIFHILVLLIIPYKIFQLYMVGNLWIGSLLVLYLGISGMILGPTIALISPTQGAGVLFVTALYFLFLLSGGMVWPLEGVISPLREICLAMPLTMPSEALRHVVHRGWSLLHRTPQLAMVSTTIWALIYLSCLLYVLRRYKR